VAQDPIENAASAARDTVKERIIVTKGTWAKGASLADIRAGFEALLTYADGPVLEHAAIGHVPAAWIRGPSGRGKTALLFCHGGGFQIGSIRSHRDLMARLAASTGTDVLGFDYRLAPEHRFPAAVHDAFFVYRWLLDQGLASDCIAVVGDSAGAALALGVALQARDNGIALPACLALISPWLDLTTRGDSYANRAALDVFSKPQQLRAMAKAYLGRNGDPLDPLASPVEADLAGLPPVLIHAGDFDITLDDSFLLASRAKARGTTVDLKVWASMYHHFQVFRELPEAAHSLDEIGHFVQRHLHGK